jgi:hypothetical protein
MPADLRVTAIALPSPLHAPCSTSVVVTIVNGGNQAPQYSLVRAFEVAVEITDSPERQFRNQFVAKVADAERTLLPPGGTIHVTVDVRFPCVTTAWVRAQADVSRTILNDAHSQPPFADPPPPTLVPSLVVSVAAGGDGPFGPQFNVASVCPSSQLWVEATVANRGCSASPATDVKFTLEDSSGQVLDSVSYGVHALSPGTTDMIAWNTQSPSLAQVPHGALVVRACVDTQQLVVDQCDRATLCAMVVKTVDAGTPPDLFTFASFVSNPPTLIFPGELPRLGWQLNNTCSDIGSYKWRLLYGSPPTAIAGGASAIGFLASAFHVIDPSEITVPPSIANAFWKIGPQKVTVEILGSGKKPGPYRADFDFVVSPVKVDGAWWTWLGGDGVWNKSYTEGGVLTNGAGGPMTVTAITLVEHPINAPDETTDVMAPVPANRLPVILAAGATSGAFSIAFFHTWTWMTRVFYVKTGPEEVEYDYTARFTVVDAFGNSYGPISSKSFNILVVVPQAKLDAQVQAAQLTSIGTAIVVAGIACFLAAPAPYDLLCLIPVAGGMAMVIAGTLRGEDALDPPIPDFSQDNEELPRPPDWRLPTADRNPAAAAFNALTLDLRRVDAAARDAARARDRAFAAFIDHDRERLRRWQGACRDALGRLERAVAALSPIIDEMYGRSAETRFANWLNVPKSAKLLAGKELVAKVREHTKELGADREEIERVEKFLEATTSDHVHAAVESLRAGRLRTLPGLAMTWFGSLRDEYAVLPFLDPGACGA